MSLASDLALFDAYDDYDPGDEPPPLDNELDADRLLRRVAAVRADIARIRAHAQADIARTQAWAEQRTASLERQVEWWERSLEGWARGQARDGQPLTVRLPHGTVQVRKALTRVDVDAVDGDELNRLVPGIVTASYRVVKDVAKQALSAGPAIGEADDEGYVAHVAVTDDGEPVPGVRIMVPTRPAFSCKPTADVEL